MSERERESVKKAMELMEQVDNRKKEIRRRLEKENEIIRLAGGKYGRVWRGDLGMEKMETGEEGTGEIYEVGLGLARRASWYMVREEGKRGKLRTRKERKAIGYEEKLEKGGGGERQGNAGRRYRKEKKGNLGERNGGRNFTGKKGSQ